MIIACGYTMESLFCLSSVHISVLLICLLGAFISFYEVGRSNHYCKFSDFFLIIFFVPGYLLAYWTNIFLVQWASLYLEHTRDLDILLEIEKCSRDHQE